MGIYTYFIDNTNPRSLNYRMRQKRLDIFLGLLEDVPRPVSILDIGGSVRYWENIFFTKSGIKHSDFTITIVNLDANRIGHSAQNDGYYKTMKMDARNMAAFGNHEFDIAHSNSVIEHVGGLQNMQRMASELLRVADRHFVQTPNFFFPIEPHFKAPFFHWLPREIRMHLVCAMKIGHLPRASDMVHAAQIVDSAQLVTRKELQAIFPQSDIYNERFLFITKSFIVTGNSH